MTCIPSEPTRPTKAAEATISAIGSRRSGSRSGFTLIEILVAVAILSVAVAAALSAFHSCIDALGASRDALQMQLLLRGKMDEAQHDPAPADARGDFEGSDAAFSWAAEVKPVGGSDGNLREVTVTVCRRRGAGSASATSYALCEEGTGER